MMERSGSALSALLLLLVFWAGPALARPGRADGGVFGGRGGGSGGSGVVTPAIVNGGIAAAGAYPFMVVFADSYYFCGGTLIHPSVVMTAAHCIPPKPYRVNAVRIGSLDATSGGTYIRVVNTVAHKQFDKSQYGLRGFQNDIALLQLATPFTGAAPALLPPAAAATDEGLGLGLGNGAPLTVSGFGKTSDTDPSVGDNVLRDAQLKYVRRSTCQFSSSYWSGSVAASHICAEDADGGATDNVCNGDSGGPLLWTATTPPTVVGIVSWGLASCEAAGWAAFTNVAAMKPWICDRLRRDFSVNTAGLGC